MKTSVENMTSRNGNAILNQFRIFTPEGIFFQSYNSVIAFISNEGKITLDRGKWNYSTTTGKYRNMFLHENMKETEKKIASGEYTLADLN